MAPMDERTKRIISIGAATAGVAAGAAGVAAYMNAEELFALGIRKTFKKNDDKRDRGLLPPKDIVRVTNLAYAADSADEADPGCSADSARAANQSCAVDPEQLLDIYYPVGTQAALPIIVSVHGGAYVYGDKDLYQFYCMSLAQKGFTVVNFSYRLAPKHKFPDQLNDINSVMKFVCAHAGQYFGDLENVFFVGDSAGAQMASQYLAAVTNPEYADLLGLDIPAFTVRAAALNCGMYELDPVREKMLIRCYLGSEKIARSYKMDVLGHMTSAYPPCFIMTATADFLRPNAKPLGDYLTRLGVENEVHVYGDEFKPLGHVFHCDVNNPYAKECNNDECEFFRRHIG